MSAWFGIFAPRDTSPEIVRLLNGKLQTVIDDPRRGSGCSSSGRADRRERARLAERVRAGLPLLGAGGCENPESRWSRS